MLPWTTSTIVGLTLLGCLPHTIVAQQPPAPPPEQPPAPLPEEPPAPVPEPEPAPVPEDDPAPTDEQPSEESSSSSSGDQYYQIETREQILESSRTLAYDLMLFYDGNQTGMVPGILPGPPTEHKGDYYWWEGGAMMGTYIDYWHLTGDESYNDVVMQGMLHQTGDDGNYMPDNHTASMGNDDMGFWGMSAMLAAENKFPNPPDDEFQWLELAQGVWNEMASPNRHDDVCGGGLRWQVFLTNVGYDYKNTIANGCFFNIGARLARYLDNETYAEWAEETWDWLWDVEYVDHENWHVYDGGHDYTNCSDVNEQRYSYNAAILAQGVAFLYNYTESDVWKDRLDNLLVGIEEVFFDYGAAFEPVCEGGVGYCSTDMLSFKGYVHRWLAVVTQIAPHTSEVILPMLRESAEMAVSQCTGGETGRVCGFYWSTGEFVDPGRDGTTGAGEAMNVLAAVSSLLIEDANPPTTNDTGGTSRGNPNAGSGGGHDGTKAPPPITTADRAGAGILTAIVVGSMVALFVWMAMGNEGSLALDLTEALSPAGRI